ncbi:thymidine kinase [Croceibacterium sp. TMG7-5b_MA50]|uniref:thymidine kinase n=1 Tax=Croceibacterium sp. TMG7-5b_MA50 TaxID=3121290 RepID=UPI003221595B
MAKLYFYYASMNAGKSTNLLQADFNYRERGMETMRWTAAIDTRDAAPIASRIGLIADAHLFTATTDLWEVVSGSHADRPLACVLVDEAQFLTPAQVWQCARIADEANIPVLCYGLRTDFRGALFPGSAVLLGVADSLIELKAVCHCGRKATMNLRLGDGGDPVQQGEQTQIGGNERYVALCRRHFAEALALYRGGAAVTN